MFNRNKLFSFAIPYWLAVAVPVICAFVLGAFLRWTNLEKEGLISTLQTTRGLIISGIGFVVILLYAVIFISSCFESSNEQNVTNRIKEGK